MSTIGTFNKTGDRFSGVINTLSLNAKVTLVPVERASESAPDYRLFAGTAEIGAGWSATAKASGREFVNLKIDDPSLHQPIYSRLVKNSGNEGYSLVWNR
jgi:uncharacterized protein (DUF736 family)